MRLTVADTSFKEFSTGLGKSNLFALSPSLYSVVNGLNRFCKYCWVHLFKMLNISLVSVFPSGIGVIPSLICAEGNGTTAVIGICDYSNGMIL